MKSLIPLLMLARAATAQDSPAAGFLEGFPDVPRLDVVTGIAGDSVLFDTPGGTVAEITLKIAGSTLNAMKQYRESLTSLGWTCNAPTIAMDCWRERHRLMFKSPAGENASGMLILRLEPTR